MKIKRVGVRNTSPIAKLSRENYQDIKQSILSHKELAAKYNLSAKQISTIKRRR